MRDQKKIDNKIYHSLYVLTKGNQFNKKQDLLESIHKIKAVRTRERSLKDQEESRKGRVIMRLKRKDAR